MSAKAKKEPEIRDRIKELRRVKASDLLPHPGNWRKHPKSQSEALSAVLREVGYADALLARETPDGLCLIDGHLRRDLTPDQEVPVLILDVNEDEANKILLTLDPLASLAEADKAALDSLLHDVTTGEPALQQMLAELAAESGLSYGAQEPAQAPEPEIDRAAELLEKWQVKSGQLWECGRHRVLCGSSASDRDVAILLASRCWMIWDKSHPVERTFAGCELAWTSLDRHSKVYKCAWDGWTKEGEDGPKLHPTQKPVKLFADILTDLDGMAIIADWFCGSGTTLIAAEQTGRSCYAMEIEAGYVAVTLERWFQMTGKTPLLADRATQQTYTVHSTNA